MNDRERFNATMHYQPRDRSPICDFGFWNETIILWYDQGLPRNVIAANTDMFFGMDFGLDWIGTDVNAGLEPLFDEVVL